MEPTVLENLGLKVYEDITDVYQRDLRQSYLNNFKIIDEGYKNLETVLKKYVDDKLGEIENGTY